jgi:hypothetical protein
MAGRRMPLTSERLKSIVEHLKTRPGHEHVRGLVRELCVVGLDVPDREIDFEVPVPEVRGRIDALFGSSIFEFKRDLRREKDDAEEGLTRYLTDRERATGRRYLGITTDGAAFVAYELEDGKLKKLDQLEPSSDAPRELLRWLDTATTARADLHPDPVTIRAEFGRDSLVFLRSIDALRKLWLQAQHIAEAQFVYGTLIEPEELFLQHTYLTIVAKTMAVRVLTSGAIPAGELLAGTPFTQVGLHGAVEADFFDWLLLVQGGSELVDRIANQVGRYRLAEIEVDVLKAIYESLIDPRQRHYLGEYYTPDWLAEWMCERVLPEPLGTRMLDPSCGSGTFLFQGVRRFLEAAERKGEPIGTALKRCTDHVLGVDVHPVAVLFARVTYLLAIGTERLRARSGGLSIPVYLGDSLQWNVRQFLTEEEVEIAVPGEPPLLFPGSVAGDPILLDTVLRAMREFADQHARRTAFESWLNGNTSLPEIDRRILAESYDLMRSLHETGRDHIWTYIVRNLTRPLWLSLRQGRPDVIIGNPPWLRYNAMSPDLQKRFRDESRLRGLWVGGKLAPHQDLSGYFFARSVERYIGIGGKIAFVMPLAALSRGQYKGFRTGKFADRRGNVAAIVRFDEVWKFDSDVQPLFEVPSCVIIGHRTATSGRLPTSVIGFHGDLPRRDATAEEARRHLIRKTEGWPASAADTGGSPYRTIFKQGATMVPRRFAAVVPVESGRFGVDPDAPLVESRVGSQDKQPWKRIAPFRRQVERRFLRPLLLGESIAPLRVLEPVTAIIPWDSKTRALLDSSAALTAGYPNLAGWLKQAEALWERHGAGRMSLIDRWNFHGGLSGQFPIAPIRIVFAASGTLPCATVLLDQRAVVEHQLYWAPVETIEEARYLASILGSEAARRKIEGLQSRGQWGARHFDKVMFTLPIPQFDPKNRLHCDLVEVASNAQEIANKVELPNSVLFQSARRRIRAVLVDTGLAHRIDVLVNLLLKK